MLMCGDIFIGNDIPVNTFTTRYSNIVIPGLTGNLRTTVSFSVA